MVVSAESSVRDVGSADCPGSLGAVQAEDQHPAQVEGGGAVVQPGVVLGGSAVAEPAVSAGDEPGDAAFDHRPVLSVDRLELGIGGADAGRPGQRVVSAEPHRLAGPAAGAPQPERAGPAGDAESDLAGGSDRPGDAV